MPKTEVPREVLEEVLLKALELLDPFFCGDFDSKCKDLDTLWEAMLSGEIGLFSTADTKLYRMMATNDSGEGYGITFALDVEKNLERIEGISFVRRSSGNFPEIYFMIVFGSLGEMNRVSLFLDGKDKDLFEEFLGSLFLGALMFPRQERLREEPFWVSVHASDTDNWSFSTGFDPRSFEKYIFAPDEMGVE